MRHVAAAAFLLCPALTTAQSIRVDTVGPGTISVPGVHNYRARFSSDGRELYFFRRVADPYDYRSYVSRLTGNTWSAPQRLELGGEHSDLYPEPSPDGSTLVFSSYRPLPGYAGPPQAHLWMARREGRRWGTPVPLDRLNRPGHYHSGVAFVGDNRLRWVQTTADWRSRSLMTAAFSRTSMGPATRDSSANEWAARVPAGARFWETSISPAGDVAILCITAAGARTADFLISIRRNGTWTTPIALPSEINTPVEENFATFTPDGRHLVFTRDYNAILRVDVAILRSIAERARSQDEAPRGNTGTAAPGGSNPRS